MSAAITRKSCIDTGESGFIRDVIDRLDAVDSMLGVDHQIDLDVMYSHKPSTLQTFTSNA